MDIRFTCSEDVLRFAIEQEEEASIFYKLLAKLSKDKSMVPVFTEMASQEIRHKQKLEAVLLDGKELAFDGNIDYVGLGKRFEPVDPFSTDDMTYEDALIVAMNREEVSVQMYLSMAEGAKTQELKNLFLALAEEETKHKIHCENEYGGEKPLAFQKP